tara:strand:+ start:44 stop:205 length:162 start_codon:yes stop_codon:yes gene_type:complete
MKNFEDDANQIAYFYHQMYGRNHALSEFIKALKRCPDLTVRDAFAQINEKEEN